ncbi:hypothetical protein [Methylobacterium sp. CM6247]
MRAFDKTDDAIRLIPLCESAFGWLPEGGIKPRSAPVYFLLAEQSGGHTQLGRGTMAGDKQKRSQVDATPEAGSTALKPPKPDEHPKAAETEAQPDKPVPNQDDVL